MRSLVRPSLYSAIIVCCLAAVGVTPALADQVTFVPTGAEQTFVVPANVTSVHALAIGGRGGDGPGGGGPGGSGASVGADIAVTPGQTLYVEVAGNGSGATGGFNGGASGGSGQGGGGGGATDIRTAPRVAGTSLGLRLLVAGGGGGGGASGGTTNFGGSAGPSPTYGSGISVGGAPGTSSAGGAGGGGAYAGLPGGLATGGAGGPGGSGPVGGGGGGGGLYGGGGGGSSSEGSGGGPGSSYFGAGVTNATIATDTTGLPSVTLVYSATVPAPVVPPPVGAAPIVPAAVCKVPNLSGRSLKAARKVLTAASCKLGTVKRKAKGAQRIVGQTPKSGKSLAAGAAVNVTLGFGHRR